MSAPPENLLRIQRQFAGHVRDPEGVAPLPGLESRRLAIYRRLVFNNVSRLMASNFPVSRRLCPDPTWNELIAGFLKGHRAETPLFPEIAREMVRYLYDLQRQAALPLPFLAELAHWEALETTVRLHPAEIEYSASGSEADPAYARAILNPTLRVAPYAWPVHRIGPHHQPDSASDRPIILLAYRKRDDSVAFKHINLLTACMIEAMQARPAVAVVMHLEAIAGQLESVDSRTVVEQGLQLVQQLRASEVILQLQPLASLQTTTSEDS